MKKSEVAELCRAFDDIIWMACRYAHGRRTYAPGMVRDACAIRAKFNDILKFAIRRDTTLDPPLEYLPYKDGKIEAIIPNGFSSLPSDDLRDLMETYKDE